MTDPPGTSPLLDQPIEFEPLTSTVLVQHIQSQLTPNSIEESEETEDLPVLENQSDRTEEIEKLEITQQKQSNNNVSGGGDETEKHEQKADESKIDEITDTANILKFSSARFVEPCETSSRTQKSQYKNLNSNNNDDEYINKNIKVAEKEGNDDESKDILEYLVTFSDSAEQIALREKESELSEKPPIPLPTYLWEDLKKAKEQGTHFFPSLKFDSNDFNYRTCRCLPLDTFVQAEI